MPAAPAPITITSKSTLGSLCAVNAEDFSSSGLARGLSVHTSPAAGPLALARSALAPVPCAVLVSARALNGSTRHSGCSLAATALSGRIHSHGHSTSIMSAPLAAAGEDAVDAYHRLYRCVRLSLRSAVRQIPDRHRSTQGPDGGISPSSVCWGFRDRSRQRAGTDRCKTCAAQHIVSRHRSIFPCTRVPWPDASPQRLPQAHVGRLIEPDDPGLALERGHLPNDLGMTAIAPRPGRRQSASVASC